MLDPTNIPPNTPRQSSEEALRFLQAIGREPPYLFRALIDDAEKKDLPGYAALTLTGSFEQCAQQLRRQNNEGRGVFVQINAADGKGFKATNIIGASCFFADFDGTPAENVARLALAPHVTVSTSPGKSHFYWRISGIPIEQFSAVQKRLIALFGSDPAVHDAPRIMRLPGFMHLKNPTAPHLVTASTTDCPSYAIADFLQALADAEREQGIQPPQSRVLPQSIAAPLTVPPSGGSADGPKLTIAEGALRHLIGLALVDLGERSEWIRIGLALKESHGGEGFAVWHRLSAEAEGYKDEADCRKTWDSFKSEDVPPEKRLSMATFIWFARDHGWKHDPQLQADALDEGGEGKSKAKPDVATVILGLAEAAGDEAFLGHDDHVYISYRAVRPDGSARRVTTRLDGSQYRGLLALRYHDDVMVKTAPREQVAAAVALMEARARTAGIRRSTYLRYAHCDGRVYVNLDPDQGIVAEIDASADEWRLVTDPPVRFVSGSRGALPMPERGGSLALFAKHFPVSPDDLTRTIAIMLSVYQPADTYPVGIFQGVAGAAKSVFCDKGLALTDPPRGNRKAARFSIATEERNLHIQASHCSVVFIDNVSTFSADVADQLCRLSTGAASSFRKHHSMDEEQAFAVARPVLITCITTPSSRADLLSRALCITVTAPEHRRTEQAVWREFDADAGKMLGFLFSCVSCALRNKPAVTKLADDGELELPRLADFALWVEAAGEKLGLQPGGFAKLLCEEQAMMQADAARRDPVVEGLVRYFAKNASEKLDLSARDLRDLLAARGLSDLPHHNQFRARLARSREGLTALGIVCEERHDAHAKAWRFEIHSAGKVAQSDAGLQNDAEPPDEPNQSDEPGEPDETFPF